jgi:chromosome partitioning protein
MKIFNLTVSQKHKPNRQRNREVTQNCQWQSTSEPPKTFCLINQKGGVGKSSSCFHLAGAYAELGARVLVIDVDPQGSISQGFFGSAAVEQFGIENSVAALFDETWQFADLNSLVHKTRFDRIDVCPANQCLSHYNAQNPEDVGMLQYALREFIEEQTAYDIVLIDCPPNLYRCTWTSLIAADWVIIPVTPEDFGTQGLRAVHQAIENARTLNPELRRLGHLVTRSDGRLLVHKFYERRLRKIYGDLVLQNLLPELSAFKVAVANRKPVQYHDPKCRAARLTRNLCREILDRTDVKTQKRQVA